MSIDLSNVSKDEYKKIMKPLPLETLRGPVVANNKLEKKYISGFRANSVTLLQLIPLYYQEINTGNKDIERILKSAILTYLKEGLVEEELKSLSDDITLEQCIKAGAHLGKSGCKYELELLFKLYDIHIDDEKMNAIRTAYCESESIFRDYSVKEEDLKKELASKDDQFKHIKRENTTLNEKKDQADRKKIELEKNVKELKSKIDTQNGEIQTLKVEVVEKEKELNSLKQKVLQYEGDITDLSKQNSNNKMKIVELNQTIKELNTKYQELESKKGLEFDSTIKKLVQDTAADLKDEYYIDKGVIDEIFGGVDGEQSILNVWRHISSLSEQLIGDVECSIRNNRVDLELIDKCNDVENNILTKYVIIKAIKALYYEYQNVEERNRTLIKKRK